MLRMKKLAAGLLAFVMLLSAVPTPALATEVEAEPCQHQYESTVIAPTCTRGGTQAIDVFFARIHTQQTPQTPPVSAGWKLWRKCLPPA